MESGLISEYARVRLKRERDGVPSGAIGVVVMVHPPRASQRAGYDVEFFDSANNTIGLVTLLEEDIACSMGAERNWIPDWWRSAGIGYAVEEEGCVGE